MGRPKGSIGRLCRKWTANEKLEIVTLHLEKHRSYRSLEAEYRLNRGVISHWVKRYIEFGLDGFNTKKSQRNKMVSLYRKKLLTEDETLRLENFKLKVENERLKKGYIVKGVGSKKVYVPISKTNIKSS
jgi:transposase-like protein